MYIILIVFLCISFITDTANPDILGSYAGDLEDLFSRKLSSANCMCVFFCELSSLHAGVITIQSNFYIKIYSQF
jgi:hypothetical protein